MGPPLTLDPRQRDRLVAVFADLGGLPLAIELLAARTATLSLDDLLDRLGGGLRLLARGPHDLPPRHRSMEATLQWSWALLDEWGQASLAACGVLHGSFDVDTAEILFDFGPDAPWAVDLLAQLVDASFVVRETAERYRLLLPVRTFAARRLADRSDGRAIALRVGAFIVARVERSALARGRSDHANHAEQIAVDRPHLLPLAEAVVDDDPGLAARLLVGASYGDNVLAAQPDPSWLHRAIALAGAASDAETLTRAKVMLFHWHHLRGDMDAATAALADVPRETDGVFAARLTLASLRDDYPSVVAATDDLDTRNVGPVVRSVATSRRGEAFAMLQQFDRAEATLRDGIAFATDHDLVRQRASLESTLAGILWRTSAGESEAKQLLERALQASDEPQTTTWRYISLAWLAVLAEDDGQALRYLGRAEAALQRCRRADFAVQLAGVRSQIHALRGELAEERRLVEQALAGGRRVGSPIRVAGALASLVANAAEARETSRADALAAELTALLAERSLPNDLVVGARLLIAVHDHWGDRAALVNARAAVAPHLETGSYVRLVDRRVARVLDGWP